MELTPPRAKRSAPRKLPTIGAPVQHLVFHVPPSVPLGLRFTGRYSEDGKPLTVHVDDVVPGSIAALSGQIGEGDRIVRVNGCSLTGVELESAIDMLKDAVRGGTVELDIVSAGQQQSTPRSVVKTLSIFASTAATPATPVRPERKSGSQVLELPQHQHGLGVTVIATNDRTGRQLVVVSSIRDEGAVPSYGGLEAGDAILTINGLTLVDQTATEITRRLQAAIGPNQLQDKQVVVDTQGSSLGISFIQDAKGSIRVAAIVPGSPADNGRIKEGMQVISLNSEVVTSVQQVKRMVLRLSRGHESMKFHFREGTVILEVYPQADVSSEKSPPSTISKASSVHDHHRNPKASLQTLLDTVEASHQSLTDRQRQQIVGLCQPDEKGLVTRREFQAAYEAVMKAQGMNVAFSRQSSALSLDLESEDEYTVRSSRKRDHELHALKQKLKSAEKTINRLQQERDAALNASNATRHDRSNDMEQDYDEIVALLEAEIAHLRSQLLAGPDEKDQQLINLRQRALVLRVQLNKAVHGRRSLEVAFEKLRDFANRTLRRLLVLSMYGPRFADKKLALRDDNSLLYRPSDGPLPPTAPWAVGDVCRVANLETGELAAAVIEKFEDYLPHMGQSFVVVRLLQYTDVPVVQTVPVNALQPLSEEDFVVAAARGGILDGKGASGASGGADMTKTEQEIHSDCRKVLGMISQLLDDGVLPFGWEEAYTADGLKYFIDHTTQTTSWVHPGTKMEAAMNQLAGIPASDA